MSDLRQMKCVACRAGEPTVTDDEINTLHPQIPEWQIKEVDSVKRLERVFKFNLLRRWNSQTRWVRLPRTKIIIR